MPELKLYIRQGKGGRWRWVLYEDGKYAGIMFIQGVATYDEAVAKTKLHFGGAVELVLSSGDPDMDWPQHAGLRDWQD